MLIRINIVLLFTATHIVGAVGVATRPDDGAAIDPDDGAATDPDDGQLMLALDVICSVLLYNFNV